MDSTTANSTQMVLRGGTPWQELYFYQKADTLYQMTFVFCKMLLPTHGYRQQQDRLLAELKEENAALKLENDRLRAETERARGE